MLKRLIIFISIFSLAVTPLFFSHNVEAASLTSIQDTMSRLQDTTLSNHEIRFVTPTGVDASTDTIIITFEATFAMGSVAFGDMDLEIDTTGDISDCGSFVTSKTLAAAPSTSPTWGAAVSGQAVTFTAPTDAASGEIAAGSCVQIEIGTNASGGSNQITNATSDGSKTIPITGTFGDTGSFAVPIMTGDQVTVTATVDPTITSSLSSTTCALGTLSDTTINFCPITNTVSTNAASGYSATIADDGNLRDGANDINDETGDSDVDQGSEEYGASSNDTTGTQAIVDSTGCDDDGIVEAATALTTTAQEYADNTGPVSGEATIVCHSASIDATTPAGSYSHIVTHITTGTF